MQVKFLYINICSTHTKTMAEDDRITKKRKRPQASTKSNRPGLKPAKKPRTAARLDNLKWKNVSMPDRMDDYEGFFGLEEVDDVEVMRDEATGMIRYLASETLDPTPNEESADDHDDGNAGKKVAHLLCFGPWLPRKSRDLPCTAATRDQMPRVLAARERACVLSIGSASRDRHLRSDRPLG